MNKQIRDYIRRHGRTAARKQFGDSMDNIDIYFDGAQVALSSDTGIQNTLVMSGKQY